MSRKAGPWGYHDQRFVGCSFGKKNLWFLRPAVQQQLSNVVFAVEEVCMYILKFLRYQHAPVPFPAAARKFR